MNYENPTRLRIGMHGVFAGKDFRIVGRVVMGVEVDGENYLWNEFNLKAKTGESATLVFDESQGSASWRLFTEFEPEYPMTAADAVLKQVGDVLNLTGEDVSVTWVGSSRIYRIEGVPQKGLKVGEADNYFNAELHGKMLVVSWTGKEVECYQGITMSAQSVAKAFSLTGVGASSVRLPYSFNRETRLGGGSSSWDSKVTYTGLQSAWLALIAALFFISFCWNNFSWQSTYEAPPVKRFFATSAPLTVGATGTFDGKNFHLTAHAVVEIAGVSEIYDRHEYELTDDLGLTALLVCGEKPDAKEWTLFTPLAPLIPPTATQSAAQKVGDTVNVDGVIATVRALFQSTIKDVQNVAPTGWHTGDLRFGYAASSERQSLLVRWDKSGSSYHRGKNVSSKDFAAAFSSAK